MAPPIAVLVDAAIVGLQIEELARLCFIEPVPAAVLAQPFLLEIIGFHLQKAGDASDIRRCIGGRHGFATVGAAQTIHLLPYPPVGIVDQNGDAARGQLSNAAQPSSECGSMKFHLPSEGA